MSKKKNIVLFLCMMFASISVFGQKIIETEGKGKTEEIARAAALQQMSQSFMSYVQSSNEAVKSYAVSGKNTTSIQTMDMRILVTSEMPLYGVTYKTSDNGLKGSALEYTVKATMDSKNSGPLYESELKTLVNKINSRNKNLPKLNGEKQDAEYCALSADYAAYEKLNLILLILGVESEIKPELSSSDFKIKYEQHSKEITTVEQAGQTIASAIIPLAGKHRIYVYPALFEGENIATEFSTVLASAVKSKLGAKLSLDKLTATAELKGSYYFAPGSVDGEDLIISYYLCGKDGAVIASSGMFKIPYKTYSQYKYIPRSYDLQAEIASGRTSNPEFAVSIRINGDRNIQEFKRGDSLIIETRATKPCYIYVIGYTYNDDGEFSYLFPLEPYADGKEMFVKKIGAKDANRWVVINPVIDDEVQNVEVIPPYGEETLYVFASTTDDFDEFVDKVPSYTETDDFYLVSGTPVQNVSKTRALNIKRVNSKASKVVNTAESVISYLTHK